MPIFWDGLPGKILRAEQAPRTRLSSFEGLLIAQMRWQPARIHPLRTTRHWWQRRLRRCSRAQQQGQLL